MEEETANRIAEALERLADHFAPIMYCPNEISTPQSELDEIWTEEKEQHHG